MTWRCGGTSRGPYFLRSDLPTDEETLAEARPDIERRLLPERHRAAVQAWLLEQEKKSTIELVPQAE